MESVKSDQIREKGNNAYELLGPLDFETVSCLRLQGFGLLDGQAELVFDLGGVERSDSAGLALLLEWVREAQRRGTEIRFQNMPPQMSAIARTSGLDKLLPYE